MQCDVGLFPTAYSVRVGTCLTISIIVSALFTDKVDGQDLSSTASLRRVLFCLLHVHLVFPLLSFTCSD